MFEFLKMVLAVVIGMILYDAVIEIKNRIRVYYHWKKYDEKEREKEWEKSWEDDDE